MTRKCSEKIKDNCSKTRKECIRQAEPLLFMGLCERARSKGKHIKQLLKTFVVFVCVSVVVPDTHKKSGILVVSIDRIRG